MACIRQMIKNEGIRALYAGYSTTLLMNVPFHAIYVNIYEFVKAQLILHSQSKDYDVKNHIISGKSLFSHPTLFLFVSSHYVTH